MRTVLLLMAAAFVAATPAIAQKKPAAEPAPPTQEQIKEASDTLSLIVSALNSKEVPQETKNGLFGCLYQNPLGKLGDGLAKTLDENKDIDGSNPTIRLMVLAKICGAPLPAASDAPAKPAAPAAPSGR
ncbi:hypothetical protein ACFO8O_04290 [Hephaestia sp. GCM10023244]|uniref:hypothetical protein n=1 Tax=unclassified Hephaestia TaxID=2631281 RepID=UPI0020777D5D|nr:hypothetical protein [Hephaestia sp. MAHUQ-44]MCM8730189.1 hypothetical protein [Hephaestia sp. MAHUQ-44]